MISSEGITHLGGDDFDQLLLDLALGQAGVSGITEAQRFRLLEECREKKEGLHPNTRKIAIDLGRAIEGAGEVIINVNDFYDWCRLLVERTIEAVERVMRKAPAEAHLDLNTVAAVYLVGGSSDLPAVARLLRERYGRLVRKSPYPHAATAIGLAIAADSEAGYSLRERFTRHFGVWREAEDGRTVTFDVLFEKDTPLPAKGEGKLTRTRLYQPAHNVGHFRYLECGRHDDAGQPAGDITPWTEVLFPFDPALQHETNLAEVPITRAAVNGRLSEELYECDEHGIIEVSIIDYATQCRRSYRLRGKSKGASKS